MYGVEHQTDEEPREFYRCSVTSEKQVAHITCGWSTIKVLVVEKSIKGYTLMVKKRHARKFRGDGPFTLYFDGTTVVIDVIRVGEVEKDGYARIGAKQADDLTEPEHVKSAWWPSWGRRPQQMTDNTAPLLFGAFVMLVICVLALPGLGEKLGTSAKIQNAFKWIVSSADDAVSK